MHQRQEEFVAAKLYTFLCRTEDMSVAVQFPLFVGC
jgi:hypothetical protein